MKEPISNIIFASIVISLTAVPAVLMFVAWARWRRAEWPAPWRKWGTLIALLCGTAGALAQPLMYLILSIHQLAGWLDRNEITLISYLILGGLTLSAAGIPASLTAVRKLRWLMFSSCIVSAALCYAAAMAAAF